MPGKTRHTSNKTCITLNDCHLLEHKILEKNRHAGNYDHAMKEKLLKSKKL